jgi:hypothetical protein
LSRVRTGVGADQVPHVLAHGLAQLGLEEGIGVG